MRTDFRLMSLSAAEKQVDNIGYLLLGWAFLTGIAALGLLETIGFTGPAYGLAVLLIIAWSAVEITVGVGLLRRRAWAYKPAYAVAILTLLGFPVGTLVGIYILWTLTKPGTHSVLTGQQVART